MCADGRAKCPSLDHILDDLCTRFLLNLPASEFESFERLFFAVESAHWFYDDFHREQHTGLPRLQLKAFAQKLFDHTPLLQPYSGDVDKLVREFKSYKNEVPTCGAAMLNPALDRVLLVRGWGKGATWGFPKGKMAKCETELQAAIREVEEETGFNLEMYTDENTFYIDSMMAGRLNRIFVVPNVPENTQFQTQTRKEISKIQWVPITSLPFYKDKKSAAAAAANGATTANGNNNNNNNNNNTNTNGKTRGSPNHQIQASKFVYPYTSRLRGWIKREKKRRKKEQNVNTNSSINVNNVNGDSGGAPSAAGTSHGNGYTTLPESSPTKPKNARTRKNQRNNNNSNYNSSNNRRDADTFGGPRTLTDAERESMFKSYVKESERRVRELQLSEDGWLTNGNRTPGTLPKNIPVSGTVGNGNGNGNRTVGGPVAVSVSTASSGSLPEAFTFDSEAIVARMLRAAGGP